MKALKWIGKRLGILSGAILLLLLASAAVNYRPRAVIGKQVDPGAIESLDGSAVRLSHYAGRVVLINFAANH